MKNQKIKATTKTKRTITKTTKNLKEIHKDKNKKNIKKRPTPFFRKIFHMYFNCFLIIYIFLNYILFLENYKIHSDYVTRAIT